MCLDATKFGGLDISGFDLPFGQGLIRIAPQIAIPPWVLCFIFKGEDEL